MCLQSTDPIDFSKVVQSAESPRLVIYECSSFNAKENLITGSEIGLKICD